MKTIKIVSLIIGIIIILVFAYQYNEYRLGKDGLKVNDYYCNNHLNDSLRCECDNVNVSLTYGCSGQARELHLIECKVLTKGEYEGALVSDIYLNKDDKVVNVCNNNWDECSEKEKAFQDYLLKNNNIIDVSSDLIPRWLQVTTNIPFCRQMTAKKEYDGRYLVK